MVLGIYYLTQERPGVKGEGKFFKSVNEAILAYENGVVTLHSRITVRMTKTMPCLLYTSRRNSSCRRTSRDTGRVIYPAAG